MRNDDKNKQNKLSGRYDIIEQVGIGGMSYVFKAYDNKRRKIVAIKMLKDELTGDEEFVEKFKSEALSSKDIKHQNVIGAYDVVDDQNMHYIVMEYMEGTTLNKYIKEKGRLSNEETIDISLQVAKGILAAHKKGIIHRDIKPQNIVIDNKNVAKITDFGIARAITSTTRNISVVGTVHYISPEQVRNTVVDFRSDIYSFGCTMYEMITGIAPFSGDTAVEIIISHLKENIKKPSFENNAIYKSLEKIILKSTRMIPRERYQSMEELIDDLQMALIDKEGTYIKDIDYDEDKSGETVIISDEDMKVIKAVSEKYTNRNTYKTEDAELTPDQKEFFDRYIKNGAYKQHLLFRKILIAAAAILAVLSVVILFIILDTRKSNLEKSDIPATGSIVLANLKKSLDGVDIEFAKNLANEYGVELNIVREEYSDVYDQGKIIGVINDNIDKNSSLDISVSKGSYDIDFTDVEKLNNTKWSDMLLLLDDRGIEYTVTEINDINIPRGYIIGVNKKSTKDNGELIFTISKGASGQIKEMPDFYGKPISEVRELLLADGLVLGNISFRRDGTMPENHVLLQSVNAKDEVKTGTTIDFTLSCGPDGVETTIITRNKWYSDFSSTYRVGKENSPNIEVTDETMIIQVRLQQLTNNGTVYTEILEPQEYKIGTVIPLMFPSLEGEEGIRDGQVQVVDVVNDVVLASMPVTFWPEK